MKWIVMVRFLSYKIKGGFLEIKLPLIIFMFSIGYLFISNKLYNGKYFFPFYEVIFSLMSGSIFYFVTVSIPEIKKKSVAKQFAIESYNQAKLEILEHLLRFCKKNRFDSSFLERNINNYKSLRDYVKFQESDYDFICNNYTKNFSKEIMINLIKIKEVFKYLTTYNFIQSNEVAFRQIFKLSSYIDQVIYDYEDRFIEDNDSYFHKTLGGIIYDFILGYSFVSGYREKDDFVDLIENS